MPVDIEALSKDERLERMRHSAAHIMAEAVLSLFPEAKLAIGPPIDTGFYYDFDLPRPLTTDDLPVIEARMRQRIESDIPFVHSEIDRREALDFFSDQPYKGEIIEAIPDGVVSLYQHDGFTDLCQGPHVNRTGEVPAFKLVSVAGAYWRGDERRPMLQRVYGALFETKEELDEHLQRLEEAQRRDHRRLGRELDLYSSHEEFGPGLTFWHPKGARVRTIIEDFWRSEHYKRGYDMVFTPHLGKSTLWETSGHLDFYQENMYAPIQADGQEYYIRPMNCPFHILIYKTGLRSYRDLPIRFGELGTVYRYERSGVLHGLMRVRGFTQDDAHIFCRPDQVEQEIADVVDLSLFTLGSFGFHEYEIYLSTKPEKAVGESESWEHATEALRRALTSKGLRYSVDDGGGAFYGPKIDIKVKDALGRSWQCATIQFDFNLPERFDVSYIGQDGQRQRPYMVHRALLGSLERFFGVLIEHHAGAFPFWLAPVQAVVIPIADRHLEYCRQIEGTLKGADYRVEVDDGDERMNAKLRRAQLQKIPYMLIAGDREMEAGLVAVRRRNGQDAGAIPLPELLTKWQEESLQRQ